MMIKASIDDYITKLKSKREYEGGDDEGSEVIEKKRQKREIILGHLRNATNEIDRSIKVVENLKSRGGGVGKKKNLFYLELSEHAQLQSSIPSLPSKDHFLSSITESDVRRVVLGGKLRGLRESESRFRSSYSTLQALIHQRASSSLFLQTISKRWKVGVFNLENKMVRNRMVSHVDRVVVDCSFRSLYSRIPSSIPTLLPLSYPTNQQPSTSTNYHEEEQLEEKEGSTLELMKIIDHSPLEVDPSLIRACERRNTIEVRFGKMEESKKEKMEEMDDDVSLTLWELTQQLKLTTEKNQKNHENSEEEEMETWRLIEEVHHHVLSESFFHLINDALLTKEKHLKEMEEENDKKKNKNKSSSFSTTSQISSIRVVELLNEDLEKIRKQQQNDDDSNEKNNSFMNIEKEELEEAYFHQPLISSFSSTCIKLFISYQQWIQFSLVPIISIQFKKNKNKNNNCQEEEDDEDGNNEEVNGSSSSSLSLFDEKCVLIFQTLYQTFLQYCSKSHQIEEERINTTNEENEDQKISQVTQEKNKEGQKKLDDGMNEELMDDILQIIKE